MLGAAVVLEPEGAEKALAHISIDGSNAQAAPPTIAPAEIAEGFARSPQAGMLDLVDAIQRGETGTLALDRGAGRGYRASLKHAR